MNMDEKKLELIDRLLKIDDLKTLEKLEELFLKIEMEERAEKDKGL